MRETIFVSFMVSAVTTIMITARVKKNILKYVNEICDINIAAVKKVKECAISNINVLIDAINQDRTE